MLSFFFFLHVSDAAIPPPVSGSSEHPYFSLTKQTKHTDAPMPFFFPSILSFTPYFAGASKASMQGQERHISLNVWALRMLSVILHALLYSSHAPISCVSTVCAFRDDRFRRCVNTERCPGDSPIVVLFFWQLRSGNVSGQRASEAGLPVPHRGSRAGVRCWRAVSLSVRCLLQAVQVWGKKNTLTLVPRVSNIYYNYITVVALDKYKSVFDHFDCIKKWTPYHLYKEKALAAQSQQSLGEMQGIPWTQTQTRQTTHRGHTHSYGQFRIIN